MCPQNIVTKSRKFFLLKNLRFYHKIFIILLYFLTLCDLKVVISRKLKTKTRVIHGVFRFFWSMVQKISHIELNRHQESHLDWVTFTAQTGQKIFFRGFFHYYVSTNFPRVYKSALELQTYLFYNHLYAATLYFCHIHVTCSPIKDPLTDPQEC